MVVVDFIPNLFAVDLDVTQRKLFEPIQMGRRVDARDPIVGPPICLISISDFSVLKNNCDVIEVNLKFLRTKQAGKIKHVRY